LSVNGVACTAASAMRLLWSSSQLTSLFAKLIPPRQARLRLCGSLPRGARELAHAEHFGFLEARWDGWNVAAGLSSPHLEHRIVAIAVMRYPPILPLRARGLPCCRKRKICRGWFDSYGTAYSSEYRRPAWRQYTRGTRPAARLREPGFATRAPPPRPCAVP